MSDKNNKIKNKRKHRPRSKEYPLEFAILIVLAEKDAEKGIHRYCKFCAENGEKEKIYTSHNINGSYDIRCPVLYNYVCQICSATKPGHTIKYCKLNKKHHFSIIEESNNPVTRLFPLEFTQNKIFDAKLAVEEAKRLYNIRNLTFGVEESNFVRILSSRSYPQLNETVKEYAKICAACDIKIPIEREVYLLEDAAKVFVQCVRKAIIFFFNQLNENKKRENIEYQSFNKLLISSSSIDIHEAIIQYTQLFNRDIFEDLNRELRESNVLLFH